MINLLKETIETLNENGKSEFDVLWVGMGFKKDFETGYKPEYKTTWEDFKKKADFEYENEYGEYRIPRSLIIVGEDFWLERHTFLGSECWEFKTMPTEPEQTKELPSKLWYGLIRGLDRM